ncbi:MAG: response regulator [Pseudomonadota bacterium]|nr:response regulator [Pseudomonadota bacterium]MDE3037822.1 response regulator [Pseudomonadota bacterium]
MPLTVLIIDDSREDHALYHEYLEDTPERAYHFIDAYSGEEGTTLYHRHAVDCVLLDYRLPDIDGLEVLARLSKDHAVAPVVMLTGEGNETVAAGAMKIGSQDYLPKRVATAPALRRAVENAVERRRLTQRMESYRRDLERSNQDLERFVSVVAHDLKSPLRAITQHLQLVDANNRDTLDDKSRQSIGFAVGGADRMRRLIDALFEFARAGFEKHPLALVDCNQVLVGVRSNLARDIEERGAIITHDALPFVMADGMQLMQLLQNLIGNALKFCKERPEIHVSARRNGAAWEFSVRDNGIGIPRAGRDKIFTIFKRLHTDEEYEGSGIGLAICERVVKNHGGSIRVDSEPGCGSTFTFTLAATEPMSEGKAA